MARLPTSCLARYLLEGRLASSGCLSVRRHSSGRAIAPRLHPLQRAIHATAHTEPPPAQTGTSTPPAPNAARATIKDEFKRRKASEKPSAKSKSDNQAVPGWELTVGIEIHAQLNTARKLFSAAAAPASATDAPNTHVAAVDVSQPGAQPVFQPAALVPAIRAALALGCAVQPASRFDRKHYFWWDQPAGYQITQYHEPFARGGLVVLRARDGIAAQDGDGVRVRIKQVQMEQDTGKTTAQPGGVQWLDFNRVGVPLVEVITEPDIRHPRTAAAFVKKVQALLAHADACVAGMELGGLRADVNVSVRRAGDARAPLGTRTEIKNLGSIKAVEDAIIAERDRQIRELESGGQVAGETRGWTIGAKATHRLRGKEGEVDYRYMPDPDLQPLYISEELVKKLRQHPQMSLDAEVDQLVDTFGLTTKDAMSLMALDNGARLQYFYRVMQQLEHYYESPERTDDSNETPRAAMVGNWVLHEMGKLTMQRGSEHNTLAFRPDGQCEEIPYEDLAKLLFLLRRNRITRKVAKQLLVALYVGEVPPGRLEEAITEHKLWFEELSPREYGELADKVLEGQGEVVAECFASADPDSMPKGKVMWLVGKMMSDGSAERVDAKKAEEVLRKKIWGRRQKSRMKESGDPRR
jgi:aspartyl-tRNA(Asn)/glutamyl-tRNA(Gln) amidotransferase subunit B